MTQIKHRLHSNRFLIILHTNNLDQLFQCHNHLEYPEIEENLVLEGSPAFNAEKLAKEKCSQGIKNAIATNLENYPVLAADTIVVMGNKIYGKPKSSDHAFTMLSELSGQVHEVITGVSVGAWDSEKADIATISVSTFVEFGDISAIELKEYSETDEPLDKAGAYAIQGYAEKFIKGWFLIKSKLSF